MKKIILILIIALVSIHLNAQEVKEYNSAFGIFGGININMHRADFSQIPGLPCCSPHFDKGNGLGFSLGLLYSFKVAERLRLDLRAGIFTWDGKLVQDESQVVYLNGAAVNGVFEHTIKANLMSLGLEPVLGYRLFDYLYLNVGVNVSGVLSKKVDQIETILQPSTGTYENLLRTRLPYSGNIPNANGLYLAALAGLNYDIGLNTNRTWILAPEAHFLYGFEPVVKNLTWYINTIRVGLALKYAPIDEVKSNIPESEKLPESGKPAMTAYLNAVGVTEDSLELPIVRFKVEEFMGNHMKPLLSYVFFNDNSAEIPVRYIALDKNQASNFKIESLHDSSVIGSYYNLLNIVGKRLTDNPDAKITIEGCNSNDGREKGNLDLSQKRAERVFEYLRDVWSIDPSRMIVKQRNLPQEPSDINDPDGKVENRRVEITANQWEIIAPIETIDTVRKVNPPVMRFKANSNSDAGVDSWEIWAAQNGKILKTINGKGEIPKDVDWRIEGEQGTVPKVNDLMQYQLTAHDKNGRVYQSDVKSIPVDVITLQTKRRERVADKYIDRYSLMLFGFDKAKLSFYNSKVIDIVKSRMRPGSTVKVVGHTDRMGAEEYNRKLSKERAQMAANSLKVQDVKVLGTGKDNPEFDNDLPEGRYYCRKVDIIVETPIE